MNLIVTKQSRARRQEQHDLYEKRIANSIEDKNVAKGQGDLGENFGYEQAIKDIENLRRIQSELGLEAPGVEIVDPTAWCDIDMEGEPRARLGAKVTIERNGERQSFLIGGAWDGDLQQEGIVPYTSPLGKAIIPKPPGYTTTLDTSGETITIISSETPTKEDIEKLYGPTKKKAAPAQAMDMSM